MKTLFKYMRSIITSFLYLILIVLIMLQFVFTFIRNGDIKISDLIDRESILSSIPSDILNTNIEFRDLTLEYIDDYINYVFYKRSYPTIIIEKIDFTSENEKRTANEFLDNLKEKLDLDYEMVVRIREINNFISNGSIYLLLNIAIFALIIILIIANSSVLKSILSLGVIFLLSSVFLLMGGSYIYSNLVNNQKFIIELLSKEVFSNQFISSFFNQALVYLGIGIVLILLNVIYKRVNRNNLHF